MRKFKHKEEGFHDIINHYPEHPKQTVSIKRLAVAFIMLIVMVLALILIADYNDKQQEEQRHEQEQKDSVKAFNDNFRGMYINAIDSCNERQSAMDSIVEHVRRKNNLPKLINY